MHLLRPSFLASAALSLGVIALTGCGGVSDSRQSVQEPSAEGRVEERPVVSQPASDATPVKASPLASNQNALAVEPYELGGVEVALLRVRRSSGDTLNVYWMLTNRSSEDKVLIECRSSWYCPYKLAAGTHGNGTYIIDSINQKKHLVVRANKKPVVSTFKTPLAISPGSSVNVWAKFPAPPADVKTVSVYIPGVAPIEDVEITE